MMTSRYLKGIIIFLIVLLCSNNTYSKNKAVPLRDALKQVTKIYGTQFVFDPDLIDGKTSAIEVLSTKKSVEDVLKDILYPHELVFLYIKSNYYSVVSKNRLTSQASLNSFAVDQNSSTGSIINSAAISSSTANKSLGNAVYAPVNITGKVVDEQNNPLSGVSITLNGRNVGAATGEDGRFAITVPALSGTLVFTYVGIRNRKFL
jgi:type II secretory pathway component GspD/PulD (secretin)